MQLACLLIHDVKRADTTRGRSAILRVFVAMILLVTAPRPGFAETKGPLRAHPRNPRYFADASGKAVLLAGAHTWNNLVDMGPSDPPPSLDFDVYLEWLRKHGLNFTRGWTWEPTRWDTTRMKNEQWRNGDHFVQPQPYQRTGPGLALDGKPKFDLTRHNPEYLGRIRERLAKAREAGVYMSVMLFEGYGVQFQPDAWSAHPMNAANNVNGVEGDGNGDGRGIEIHQLAAQGVTELQKAYLRWLVEGLNEYDNLLYEVSNETHPSSTEWQYEVIRFVKEVEASLPWRHPVGMTYQHRGGANQALLDSPADWISPNSAGGFRDNPPDWKGVKIVLADTDHLWGIGGDEVWVWKTFTRGLNPIFMDVYEGRVLSKTRPQDERVRLAMGQALRVSAMVDLARTTPRGELASTGYCLAEPGACYVVYAPNAVRSVEVDLSAETGRFKAEWIDPVSGEKSPAGNALGGARREFRVPIDGPAVLLLLAVDEAKSRGRRDD